MAKIHGVIQIKLNQFKKMFIWSLTYQKNVYQRYHSDKPSAALAMPGGPGAQNGKGGPKWPELCIKTVIRLCTGISCLLTNKISVCAPSAIVVIM